jgi:hypothetical protein
VSNMHEPLSWLTLERYALGELLPDERARVEAQLSVSEPDQRCLDGILADQSELPPLPALPIPIGRRRQRRLLWGSSALAVAAALLFVFVGQRELPGDHRYVSDGTKGGEMALVVHGEQSGASTESFAQGERFKLLVTCPGWLSGKLRVVLFQGGQRYQPLPPVQQLACGNLVPWPGAFALDGSEPVDVCVSYGEDPRAFAQASTARALEPTVVCTRLSPR